MSDPLLQLEALGLRGKARWRLRDVTATLECGVTAVLGSSGSGKSSLLNILVRYEKPDVGSLLGDVSRFWAPATFGLWPKLTALEQLTHTRKLASEAAARDWLDRFDLGDCVDSRPRELSQGQQDRLAIARALFSSASLLVFDEPLAHVDPLHRCRYWAVIREELARSGRSLCFASHDPGSVLAEANRVWCLREGELDYVGEVRDLYERPPTEALAHCLGRTNWLTPNQADRWLGQEWEGARSLRPERLRLSLTNGGPLLVLGSRHYGGFWETRLRREDGECMDLLHGGGDSPVREGLRVALRLLLLMLVLLVQLGCREKDMVPEMAIATLANWRVPIEGPRLPAPRSVAIGLRDEVVVLDNAGRVLVYNADGSLNRQWPMPASAVGNPEGVAVFPDGRVVVCDTHYHRVVLFDSDGRVLKMFGEFGRGPGQFIYPVAVALDAAGLLYIGEYGENDRIQKFTEGGECLGSIASFGTGPGQLQRPSGIVWKSGKLYVVDAVNNRIQVFADSGAFEKVLALRHEGRPVSLHLPYDLKLDGAGEFYLIEYGAARITRFREDGTVLERYGRQGAGNGEFVTPWALGVDSEGRLRVADTGNRRLVSLIRG